MDRRTQAQVDAAIAEFSSLALAGDVARALDLVDQQIKIASGSTFTWAQLQARLLHAAMDDPRMPTTLLAALVDRFRWAEPISALSRFHPDLRARVAARLAAAEQWREDLQAAARQLDDDGAAARLALRPGQTIDAKTLAPGVLRALQAIVNGAERHGALLGGAIDLEAIAQIAEAIRVDSPPIDPLAHVGRPGSRLPDGARWAIALSAMYTIAQRGVDATLAPFAPPRPAQSLTILRDYWRIDGATPATRRAQTIERLDWLINVGDRADPQCAETDDPEADSDLLAWDLARAAMTARHAFLAGCLSEAEAWAHLLIIALKAQASFESWRDYGERYRRGRIRWSNAQHDRFDAIMAFLVDDPRSPWRALSWRLRLDEGNVGGAAATSAGARGENSGLARWRGQGGLRMRLTVIVAIALLATGWEAARRLYRAPIAVAQTPTVAVAPTPDPPDDPTSAAGEFARIKVVFVANGDGARAQFRTPPLSHPLTDFRYGVDHPVPDRALTPKALESSFKGLPQALDLPPGAQFLTIQARLDTDDVSPVRRFDVPAGLSRPRR